MTNGISYIAITVTGAASGDSVALSEYCLLPEAESRLHCP